DLANPQRLVRSGKIAVGSIEILVTFAAFAGKTGLRACNFCSNSPPVGAGNLISTSTMLLSRLDPGRPWRKRTAASSRIILHTVLRTRSEHRSIEWASLRLFAELIRFRWVRQKPSR